MGYRWHFSFSSVDCIQYGYWPSANARYLIGKETCIVCSPQLRDALPLRTTQDLMRATLLQHIEVPLAWQGWMQANSLDTSASRFGPGFNLYSLIIRAAVSGFGVGIVPTCLVEDELAAGTLVEPLKDRFDSPLGYYLCAPTARTNLSVHRLVAGWPGGWSIAATMGKGWLCLRLQRLGRAAFFVGRSKAWVVPTP